MAVMEDGSITAGGSNTSVAQVTAPTGVVGNVPEQTASCEEVKDVKYFVPASPVDIRTFPA